MRYADSMYSGNARSNWASAKSPNITFERPNEHTGKHGLLIKTLDDSILEPKPLPAIGVLLIDV